MNKFFNKKNFLKVTFIFFIILISGILMWRYINNYLYKSRAANTCRSDGDGGCRGSCDYGTCGLLYGSCTCIRNSIPTLTKPPIPITLRIPTPTLTKPPIPTTKRTPTPTATLAPGQPTNTPTPIPTRTPTSTLNCSQRPQGDANCDGNINGVDYSMWLNRQCNSGCANENLKADFNGDNKVNDDDYSIWFNNRQ